MNQDTLTEILLQSDVNEYPILAQTNQFIYQILNNDYFWIKKYEAIGLNKQIFYLYTAGGDLSEHIQDYNLVIENITLVNIIIWILNVEADGKKYKNRFISYDVEYELDYPFKIEAGDNITIAKYADMYKIKIENINVLFDEKQVRELLIILLREGNTIFDNKIEAYFPPDGRRYGLKQAYNYINKY